MNNLKISNINQLHKYKNYSNEDFRDTIFKYNYENLDKKVNGLGNHDRILSHKNNRTYMTYYSESPFGKLLIKVIKINK